MVSNFEQTTIQCFLGYSAALFGFVSSLEVFDKRYSLNGSGILYVAVI